MGKVQRFEEWRSGYTATLTKIENEDGNDGNPFYRLVIRNCCGREWHRNDFLSADDAKRFLSTTGAYWHTTSGLVEDD